MRGNLVVISRSGWIRHGDIVCFQDNDGFYLDGVAQYFREVSIISQEFRVDEHTPLYYRFQFKSSNVFLQPGMGQISSWKNGLTDFFSVMRFISRAEIVYSFVNTLRGSIYLLLASILFRKPCIAYSGIDRRALLCAEGKHGVGLRLRLWLESWAMRTADVRIVTGPALYARYQDRLNTFMAAPISGVIRAYPIVTERASKQEHIGILCVAHLHRRKNIDILIRAIRLLKDRGKNFVFNIIGDGPARDELQQLAEQLDVSDCVCFHGYIDNPAILGGYYLENDIFLFASTVEGFPRAVWEALHFGLYVILAKVGGVETLFDAEDMTILDEPSHELFATAILRVIDKPKLRQKAVVMARRKFQDLFNGDPFSQFARCLEILP